MAKQYSPEEDAKILAYAEDAKKNGVAIEMAFIALAESEEMTDRDHKSIEGRYYRIIAKKSGSKGSKKPSDTERITSALRNLSNISSRNQEKADTWKTKFEETQKELKRVNGLYKNLQSEHQTLLETVSDVLGVELSSTQPKAEQMEIVN